jgi:hypothetical protein
MHLPVLQEITSLEESLRSTPEQVSSMGLMLFESFMGVNTSVIRFRKSSGSNPICDATARN